MARVVRSATAILLYSSYSRVEFNSVGSCVSESELLECCSSVDRNMGMRFFGGSVGHKSTCAATDYFLGNRDHSDLGIDGQHDSIDNLMDWEDEAADSPVVEGSVLDGDDDCGYDGDPLDELEDVVSDDPEDDDSRSEKNGALEGGSWLSCAGWCSGLARRSGFQACAGCFKLEFNDV
jgi:hypothetical protein